MSHYSDTDGCATVILAVLLVIALMFISPAIAMWLWNGIAVDLFGLPVVTYWQMFGLKWLCGILFRGVTTVKVKG